MLTVNFANIYFYICNVHVTISLNDIVKLVIERSSVTTLYAPIYHCIAARYVETYKHIILHWGIKKRSDIFFVCSIAVMFGLLHPVQEELSLKMLSC